MWEKDIWTTLSTVACLEQLSGKINWGWNTPNFKMQLQCSRGHYVIRQLGGNFWNLGSWSRATGTLWTRLIWCFKLADIWEGEKEIGKAGEERESVGTHISEEEETTEILRSAESCKSVFQRAQGYNCGRLCYCHSSDEDAEKYSLGACLETWASLQFNCGFFSSWHLDIWKRLIVGNSKKNSKNKCLK